MGVGLGQMTELVRYDVAEGVATITMDQPPLNTLGQGLRAALLAAIERAEADAGVRAVVLSADGRSWPVGGDIREFGKPPVSPSLPDVCLRLASLSKPVIAALHGSVLGGGLELALVCASRVALAGTNLGLPEVTLGAIPGAGGTQRLPYLIGPKAALQMILSAAPVRAERALTLGLVDKVVADDVTAHAQAIARAHTQGSETLPPFASRRRPGAADPSAWLNAIAAERARKRAPWEKAAMRAVDCVEAALLLPPAQGLAFERTAFLDLTATPEARALRHAFFAEKRAARSVGANVKGSELAKVVIVGGGAIGAGLATECLTRGMTVTLIENDAQSLARGLTRVAKGQDAAVARGTLSDDKRLADWGRLSAIIGIGECDGADLVIEAVTEDMAMKAEVLARIDQLAPANCPVLSVTCALDPIALAHASGRPALHGSIYLTDPVRRATLIELATAPDAEPNLLGAVQGLARQMGWKVLRNGPEPGFLGKRLLSALHDAADRCLEAGATPHEVDRAARLLGLSMGPYETADLYGFDHPLMAGPVRRQSTTASPVGTALRLWLVANGRKGRRGGGGYHLYRDDGRVSQGDQAVIAQCDSLRPRRQMSNDALRLRLLAGLANSGAWLLDEGRARHASDIDLVMMGQGFARWRGGPMQCADEAGLVRLRNHLMEWAKAGDSFWEPAPLWDELIKNGQRFDALDGE